jgi:hypothetical protein
LVGPATFLVGLDFGWLFGQGQGLGPCLKPQPFEAVRNTKKLLFRQVAILPQNQVIADGLIGGRQAPQ